VSSPEYPIMGVAAVRLLIRDDPASPHAPPTLL
jgi:hypothetical protein